MVDLTENVGWSISMAETNESYMFIVMLFYRNVGPNHDKLKDHLNIFCKLGVSETMEIFYYASKVIFPIIPIDN